MNSSPNRLAMALVMGLAGTGAAAMASSAPPFSFYGTWRIHSLVGYSAISIDPDDLIKLVGKEIVISKTRLKIADDDCRIGHLHESTRETSRLLLEEEEAGPEDAGVPAHTRVLQTDPCGNVFRVGNDIVVNAGGGFFRASRMTERREHHQDEK